MQKLISVPRACSATLHLHTETIAQCGPNDTHDFLHLGKSIEHCVGVECVCVHVHKPTKCYIQGRDLFVTLIVHARCGSMESKMVEASSINKSTDTRYVAGHINPPRSAAVSNRAMCLKYRADLEIPARPSSFTSSKGLPSNSTSASQSDSLRHIPSTSYARLLNQTATEQTCVTLQTDDRGHTPTKHICFVATHITTAENE